MLRECITLCPDDLWTAGKHPRAFWRIAYHALFYCHYYAMPDHETFTPWDRHLDHGVVLWDDDEQGLPPTEHPYSQADLVGYLDWINDQIPAWLKAVDLDSNDSGFPWYPVPKLEHLLVNLRHVGVHIGQLQELLYARGLEPRWKGAG